MSMLLEHTSKLMTNWADDKGGRLLIFGAFRVGPYSRWALI